MCLCVHISIASAVKNSIKAQLTCQQQRHETTITIGALGAPSKEIQAIRKKFYPLKKGSRNGFFPLDLCAGQS